MQGQVHGPSSCDDVEAPTAMRARVFVAASAERKDVRSVSWGAHLAQVFAEAKPGALPEGVVPIWCFG